MPNGKATYVLPRYLSFTEEIVNDAEKFSNALLYYLGISLERFKWQDQIHYREAFEDMEEESRRSQDKLLDETIRPGLKRRYKDIYIPKSVYESYKSLTRLFMDLILLRHAHRYDTKLEDIFEQADSSNPNIAIKEITSPNHILDIVLRMLVLTLDAIIIDSQRSQVSDNPELVAELTKQIRSCYKQSQTIHTALTGDINFKPSKTNRRHQLDKNEIEDFREMYREISGELFKVALMCQYPDPKFRMRVGGKIIGDRGEKLTYGIDETKWIEDTSKLAIQGIEPFFTAAVKSCTLYDLYH